MLLWGEKRKRGGNSVAKGKCKGHDIRRRWLIPWQTCKLLSQPIILVLWGPATTRTRANTQLICGSARPSSSFFQVPAAPAMQDDPPQEHGYTRQVLEIVCFIHCMVSTCVQTQCKHLRQTILQILIFPLLLGDHLANHHSLCKTLFSLIKRTQGRHQARMAGRVYWDGRFKTANIISSSLLLGTM